MEVFQKNVLGIKDIRANGASVLEGAEGMTSEQIRDALLDTDIASWLVPGLGLFANNNLRDTLVGNSKAAPAPLSDVTTTASTTQS
ncbi:hypothetical protein HC761_00065 [bacterium]|nr:hypothetical protein [bacterium]